MEIFCVYQYFADGSYECTREWVDAEEAVVAAKHYTSSVAAKMGMVTRVVIVGTDDTVNFEWKYGEGVTFPRRAIMKDN